MQQAKVLLVSTGASLARAERVSDQWEVKHILKGTKINCITNHPSAPQTIYMGTQSEGLLVSVDAGATWQNRGALDLPIKSLAIDPSNPQTIYAGCKPVSLFVSHDAGFSWEEMGALRSGSKWWWFSPADPPGMAPYVSGLAVSPDDPNVIIAGIEAGALLRSEDGGKSWSKHLPKSDRDCHDLKFHLEDGNWVYQAGGLHGVAFSKNGGRDWQRPEGGIGPKYGWAIAADPSKPEIWYLSAAEQGNLLRGEFTPPGHRDGQANAHIYRKIGDAHWEQLSGGLPEPLDYMAYALAVIPGKSGHIYAGLGNGQIWFSQDFGDHWQQMPFKVDRVHTSLIVIDEI